MAYFMCTSGYGKGNTVVATCASEFAGLTVTLSKTGKSYRKICPLLPPYTVTFYGVETGTYTLSCTVDGVLYSETVTVQDISAVLNYGFNWQMWVDSSVDLDSSDYSSLEEVLSDEPAVRELMLVHDCVDYMASIPNVNPSLETVINNDLCAKWINLSDYALDTLYANEVIADLMDEADKYGYGEWTLMPQVPNMTTNTAPYGEAFGSSTAVSNSPYYYAFDGSDSTYAQNSASTLSGAYLGYHFVTPIKVKYVVAKGLNAVTQICVVQGSNDNVTWDTLSDDTSIVKDTFAYINLDNENAYSYYRMYQKSTASSSAFGLYTLQFYAWAPKGNVPVMTSNTAPYGEASGTNVGNSTSPYMAFDGNETTKATIVNTTSGAIVYKFTNPICPKAFKVRQQFLHGGLKYQLLGSNDGTTYTALTTEKTETQDLSTFIEKVDCENYYLYFKLSCGSVSGSDWGDIFTLQFYGRELSVSVPVMTSNTAPYGEASAKDIAESTMAAWKAFDGLASGTSSTYFLSGTAVPTWVQYKFNSPKVIKVAYLVNINYANQYRCKDFKIQASNDNSNWTDLYTGTCLNNANKQKFELSNTNEYLYYRLYIQTAYSGAITDVSGGISEIQFYGLDYSEKEFEAGTTKKWLYDHGVELEPMTRDAQYSTYASTSCSITDLNDSTIRIMCDSSYGTNGYYSIGMKTQNAIDMNDYGLVRLRNNLGTNTQVGLDIASVNASAYVFLFAQRFNTTSNMVARLCVSSQTNPSSSMLADTNNAVSIIDFTELWLE